MLQVVEELVLFLSAPCHVISLLFFLNIPVEVGLHQFVQIRSCSKSAIETDNLRFINSHDISFMYTWTTAVVQSFSFESYFFLPHRKISTNNYQKEEEERKAELLYHLFGKEIFKTEPLRLGDKLKGLHGYCLVSLSFL